MLQSFLGLAPAPRFAVVVFALLSLATLLVALLEKLNQIGGAHGVGRVDLVENRLVGIKSRGVYETPGGSILHAAHREVERLVLDRDTFAFKQQVAQRYAQLIYDGLWFSPLREALHAFVLKTQEDVTGEVRLRLFKGRIEAVGRRSPRSSAGRCNTWRSSTPTVILRRATTSSPPGKPRHCSRRTASRCNGWRAGVTRWPGNAPRWCCAARSVRTGRSHERGNDPGGAG